MCGSDPELIIWILSWRMIGGTELSLQCRYFSVVEILPLRWFVFVFSSRHEDSFEAKSTDDSRAYTRNSAEWQNVLLTERPST
jgi:hypothetical protein